MKQLDMYDIRKKEIYMDSKPKHTMEKRKEDGKFKKKHINHDPQAESSRAVFSSDFKNKVNENEES